MKISTKGRYAIRVMIDLAKYSNGEYTPLQDIAKRQEISEKYLEAIVSVLSKNDLLYSLRGKGGGYKLAKPASDYTVGEILRIMEGPLVPVACLEKKPNRCERAAECDTIRMWEGLERVINEYLDSITLEDLVENNDCVDNYVI